MTRPRLPPDDWPRRNFSTMVRSMPHDWHVQVSGTGPDLLLLHGAGASAHSFRRIAPLLKGYRLIVPDLPGHGYTRTTARDRLGLDTMADDLALLCQGQGWKPACIIGHSAGAAVALRLAEIMPSPPRALVGINAALGNFEGMTGVLFPILAKMLATSPFIPHLLAGFAGRRKKVEQIITSTGSKLEPEDLDLYARLMAQPSHVDGTLTMMAQWRLDPLLARLPQISVPTLLITAAKDVAVPPQVSRAASVKLPRVEYAEIPSFGHLVHEEAPDNVAALVLPFLARQREEDHQRRSG